MSQHLFDGDRETWKRKIEEMLLQHHADIQRLQKRQQQYPREFVGEMPHQVNAFQTTTTTGA